MEEQVPPELRTAYSAICGAFPHGVPDDDYFPLLAALHGDFSDEALANVMAAVTGKDAVVVDNDHASAVSVQPPADADVRRVADRLHAAGYRPE